MSEKDGAPDLPQEPYGFNPAEDGPLREQTLGVPADSRAQGSTQQGSTQQGSTPKKSADILATWPEESREAAQLVVDKYGEPHEAQSSQLVWFDVGEWKRVVATKEFWEHRFPAPHNDSVESVIAYRTPPDVVSTLAAFDGSVVVRRTMGEISATCHDEEANRLALNLADDIVNGRRSVDDARTYYSKEFLDARRGQPTPYMNTLSIEPQKNTADPDSAMLSDEELQRAQSEGAAKGSD